MRIDNFFWLLESRILEVEEKKKFLSLFYKDGMVLFLESILF